MSMAARLGMKRSLKVEGFLFSASEESALIELDSCFFRSQRARTPLRMEVFASENPLLRISSKSTTFDVILLSSFRESEIEVHEGLDQEETNESKDNTSIDLPLRLASFEKKFLLQFLCDHVEIDPWQLIETEIDFWLGS